MSYDRKRAGTGPQSLGWGGQIIDLGVGDFEVPDSVTAVMLTTVGDVVCNAAKNILLTGLPAGYILPWHCSHIRKTGTTASLATVAG